MKEGWYPSVAPVGYQNHPRGSAVRISPDPERAPIIATLFDLFATGEYTLKQLTREASLRGLVGTRSAKPLSLSRIRGVLANPFYTGRFRYLERVHDGNHKPVITHKLFNRVQEELLRRGEHSMRKREHHHPAQGLVRCACGRLTTLDAPKKGYLYFRCRGREECTEKYTNATVVEAAIQDHLDRLQLSDELLLDIEIQLAERVEKREEHRVRFAKQMENRIAKLERELSRAYKGWKEGIVPDSMFLSDQERIAEEQRLLTEQLETIQETLVQKDEMAVLAVELAKQCGSTYRGASPEVQQLFVQAFFEHLIVRDGRVVNVVFNDPFTDVLDGSVKTRWRRHTGTKPNSSDLGLRRLRELGTLVDPT